jgi:PD-(D/E)XK nuclease superfamily
MAEIDNSAANTFRECPYKYAESYLTEGTGLEPQPYDVNEVKPLELGSRVHELLEEHYKLMSGRPIVPYPEHNKPAVEMESQIIFQAYLAKYPVEDIEVVDVERTFRAELPILCPECYSPVDLPQGMLSVWCEHCNKPVFPNRHVYTGKIDLTYRTLEGLFIRDHKTQNRTAKSNLPQKWAARDQASLYLWVAEKIYGEPINRFEVNILIRPSPKFQEPPIFPERQRLERTKDQIAWALRDIVMVADDIDKYKRIFGDSPWPSHKENCYTWGQCEFYLPHTYGWSDEIRKNRYQPKTPYLDLGGVKIIQP